MDIDAIPAPLLRLKIWIWVHSAIGAGLMMGSLVAALTRGPEGLTIGLLACLVFWMMGFGGLRKKAAELAPEDRVAAKGLPLWIPIVVGLNGILCPLWAMSPFGGVVATGWVLLGGTIAVRWITCSSLAIPVHRKTWGGLLVALSIPFVLGFLLFLMVWDSMGC